MPLTAKPSRREALDLTDQAVEEPGPDRSRGNPYRQDADGFRARSRARHAAEEALLDRTVFTVSPEAYAAFLARLDEPPKANERLRRTMQTPPPWEYHCRSRGRSRYRICTELNDFSSGVGSLDEWLKRRARANQVSGASRTFVVADIHKVVGYYALASGAITVAESVGRFRRNMPDPIPVAVLGRLAIDRSQQGRGLGRGLFRDCALRVAHAADTIGIRGIIVHAISEQAKAFYLALGFDPSPVDPMTLMVRLGDVRQLLESS